jgi:glycosyltransferase involved in cell wall biosynthesis
MPIQKQRLLFIVNEDWAFVSHFIERAVAAKEHGYDVAVVAHCTNHRRIIESAGLTVFEHGMSRSGTNPFREIASVLNLIKVIRNYRPTLIHLIALKPIVLGSCASIFFRKARIICAPIGMGYLFSSDDSRARRLRPIVNGALRIALKRSRVAIIIENQDDMDTLKQGNFVKNNQIYLIKGAGVNLNTYRATSESDEHLVVSLFARMLRDKGVVEFVQAANTIKQSRPDIQFQLIGGLDDGNPAALSSQQIQDWVAEGSVTWLGQRSDVPELLTKSNIVVLPSYREGLPKVLIEAAAAQRAVIATDVVGCREAVTDGLNGLLIKPRDSHALSEAIKRLVSDQDLRHKLAQAGRFRAENEFSSEIINAQTLAVYQQVLSR